MAKTFEASATTRAKLPVLGDALIDQAFRQAEEFITAGQNTREATSIVANLMIRAAWIVAGCGAVADSDEPRKERFREAVEAVLDGVQFNRPEDGGRNG